MARVNRGTQDKPTIVRCENFLVTGISVPAAFEDKPLEAETFYLDGLWNGGEISASVTGLPIEERQRWLTMPTVPVVIETEIRFSRYDRKQNVTFVSPRLLGISPAVAELMGNGKTPKGS